MIIQAPELPDLEANKKARAALKLLWLSTPSARAQIKQRCADDFEFFADHFALAHDEHAPPRERIKTVMLWPIQREISAEIIKNVWRCANDQNEEWNAYGDKARYMAWTWLVLLVIQWFFMFHRISTVITSKTEDDVDRQGDMDTPFEKLRFQIENMYAQAPWLFPEVFDPTDKEHYKKRLIAIPGAGAKITGAGSKGADLRQGRALIWFGDEFPHTENDNALWDAACGTVRVRIVGGTPNIEKGRNCKAYKIRYNKDKENATIFEMPWYKNPIRAQGLYVKPDGSLSSPWFDGQVAKKSRQTIAAEFLMDWNVAAGRPPLYAFREDSCRIGLQPDYDGSPILCSWDPGKHFGIKWLQMDRYGRLLDLRELYLTTDDVGEGKTLLDAMAERALWINSNCYREFEVIHVGDPYGSRTQIASQEKSEYELLFSKHKIRVISAYMYAITAEERKKRRHSLLNDLMGSDIVTADGKVTPKYLIDPRACPLTYEAIKQGYRWKIVNGEETDEIARSHPDTEMVDCAGMAAIKLFKHDLESQSTGKGPRVTRKTIGRRRTGTRYA